MWSDNLIDVHACTQRQLTHMDFCIGVKLLNKPLKNDTYHKREREREREEGRNRESRPKR